MAHPSEGTLQGYLDEELTPAERAGAAEHLLACDACRATLDDLRDSREGLTAALAELDVPAPDAAPPRLAPAPPGRRVAGGRTALRAAVLVLVAAAAASALVPGSPVRDWVTGLLEPAATRPDERQAPAPEAQAPEPIAPVPRPAEPAGVAVPSGEDLEVAITGLRDAAIRLVRTEAPVVAVWARSTTADPLFRLRPGRIEVVGGAGGEIVVEVAAGAGTVRLLVDGRRYAEVVGGELRVLVPGQRDGDAVVWR